jgi:hypothetical protein
MQRMAGIFDLVRHPIDLPCEVDVGSGTKILCLSAYALYLTFSFLICIMYSIDHIATLMHTTIQLHTHTHSKTRMLMHFQQIMCLAHTGTQAHTRAHTHTHAHA